MQKNGDFLSIFCLNWQKTKTVIHTTPRKTVMYKLGHLSSPQINLLLFCANGNLPQLSRGGDFFLAQFKHLKR